MREIQEEELFVRQLRARGLRVTPERRALLREIFAQHRHIDAEEILAAVRASGHAISRATVYRNLDLLVDCGLVSRVRAGARAVFEHLHPGLRHDHVVCRDCGRLVEFVSPGITALLGEICRAHGFAPKGNELQVLGRCRECVERSLGAEPREVAHA